MGFRQTQPHLVRLDDHKLKIASDTIDLIIVGVAVLALTGVIFLARRQTAQLGLQAKAAYPGIRHLEGRR
jgi:hypothetical protein